MSLESAITFFIAIFIFGITPGPGVFALLARALVSGAASCFPLALGMAISDIVYLVLACFGLAAIAHHWEFAFTLIRFAGAAYLLYLGYRLFTTPVSTETTTAATTGRAHFGSSFVQGFLISASNPKVILFYIAFLPTFMDMTVLSGEDIVLASVLTLIALMLGLMLIAIGAATARRYIQSQQAMKRLNQSAGAIMAGAGVYLASRS